MKIREINHQHPDRYDENDPAQLRRRIRRLLNQKNQGWDQGFRAAVEMLEAGASLNRLREMLGEFEEQDTAPIDLLEGKPRIIDIPPDRTS